jgi:hypothetical protein
MRDEYEERAAIIQYDGGYTREEAERMANQLAAYTGPDAKEIIIAWVREQGYVSGQVKIKQQGETVWVELVDEGE